jgi:hypothetical protein
MMVGLTAFFAGNVHGGAGQAYLRAMYIVRTMACLMTE